MTSRVRLASLVAALVVVGAVAPAARATPSAPSPLHQVGRWLVDHDGRAVVLHGVNQVRKLPPYQPSAIGFGADDAAYIASQGFNTVRTGYIHKGIAPEPGAYDAAYVADVAATVDVLADHGLYVLVDFHQDMFNERYQGEGLADWAVTDSAPTDPTSFPQCATGFPGNLFTCNHLWESYDHLFGLAGREVPTTARDLTLQEEYADAWRTVAQALRDQPLVFGYDLFNEPHPGSQLAACINPSGCPPEADAKLTAFHNLVADAIREVDRDTIVFYEPYTLFNAGPDTHHGDVDAGQVGMSFHLYGCPFSIPGAEPPPNPITEELQALCGPTNEQLVFDNAEAQSAEFDHALLLTEFGATDNLAAIDRMADLADANMVGWQYWAWWNEDPCCERPDEGIIDHPSNPPTSEHLDEEKLDVLVRTYPRAVAGTPTGWSWDEEQRRFELAYRTEPVGDALARAAATEVWVPQRHFPDGYEIVELSGGRVVSPPGDERLLVRSDPSADDVSFAVVPGGASRDGADGPDGAGATGADGAGDGTGSGLPATGGGAGIGLVALLGAAGLSGSATRRRRASGGRRDPSGGARRGPPARPRRRR